MIRFINIETAANGFVLRGSSPPEQSEAGSPAPYQEQLYIASTAEEIIQLITGLLTPEA